MPCQDATQIAAAAAIAGPASVDSEGPAETRHDAERAPAPKLERRARPRRDTKARTMIGIAADGGRKPVPIAVSERGRGAIVAPFVAIIEMPRK